MREKHANTNKIGKLYVNMKEKNIAGDRNAQVATISDKPP